MIREGEEERYRGCLPVPVLVPVPVPVLVQYASMAPMKDPTPHREGGREGERGGEGEYKNWN